VISEPGEPRIVGAVLLEQRRVMETLLGPAGFERGLSSLPGERRDEFENLTMLSWCRRTTVIAVSEAMAEAAGLPAETFVQQVVRESLERTFRGVWRVLLKFNSDEALVKRASLIYSKTCDRGWLKAALVSPGLARVKMGGWPQIDELDAVAFAAGIETILRLAGRSYVKVEWRRAGDEVHFEVRTTPGSTP
jgi:hypothetical protein